MKSLKYFLAFTTLLLLISCKKKEEEITIEACIDGPTVISRGESVYYSWCGTEHIEVTWTSSFGQTTTDHSFYPDFPSIGIYTITATGKKGDKTESKSIEVTYGVSNQIKCSLTNACFSGNQNILQPGNYKAYLYRSLTDWKNDVTNATHNLALDSSTFLPPDTFNPTIYTNITTTYTDGSVFFSIENGDETNWSDLLQRLQANKEETYGGQLVLKEGRETTATSVANLSKPFLRKKFILKKNVFNGNTIALSPCTTDDYLIFFADGTWNYEIGADDCGGTAQTSNGTFLYLPTCSPKITFGLNTTNGPFSGLSSELDYSVFRVEYKVGSQYGFYEFAQ